MVAVILLTCGMWTLIRSNGITGGVDADLEWRWTETPEEQLLSRTDDDLVPLQEVLSEAEADYDWPGFRGPGRDNVIRGVQIETDWSASPPIEMWRRPIGPGCSSFAVRGALLYTQEQRGEDEIVSCYSLYTGDPVWRHRDAARFWDSHAGAGPRGTPTISGGHIYTLGATGILNVLDALDGSVVWSRNAASDINAELPGWGFASSPLVVGDVVIVAVAGTLIAYDIANGEPRWFGPEGGKGYSSPHLLTIDGVMQLLIMCELGVIGVAPDNGSVLWEHSWPGERIIQPALAPDGDLLIGSGEANGLRRISVAHRSEKWDVEERWTTKRLRPNFNDIVIHNGYAFGFNGVGLACIDIEDGTSIWKGGRFGGQIILLADHDVLLVLSEKGELALVEALPDGFTELARIPAIEGKTWNHPVLVGNILVVRNSTEMAAFRLPLGGG
ncbi:PQQ-binding-like beta-propeller repeat protein [Candidatus Latescibacterota bacterium]